jgi:hypothetical protein
VDAIKPIDAGERVQAAVIDRPFENLRARTEELRKKVEELLYRADADKWIITGGNIIGQVAGPTAAFPTVTWDATAGSFTVSEAIVVQPFVSPNTDIFALQQYTFAAASTFIFEANDDVLGLAPVLSGDILYDYQLANSIRIIWEVSASLGAGVFCVATLEGSPDHIVRIVIRNDSSTLASHVEDALNTILAPVIAASPIKFSLGGLGTTVIDLADIAGYEDVVLTGTYSRELHRIATAELAAFFAIPAYTLTDDGDGIGIWYEELIDSNPAERGGRRQATPTTFVDAAPLVLPPNTEIPSSKLFKFSLEPNKIPGCIPLCRRIGTYLVFIDGTVVEHGQTAQFGLDNAADIYSAAIVDSPSSLAAGTIHAQMIESLGHINDRVVLTDLAQDTGASDGTTLIGAEAITGTPTSTTRGTQKNTNTELLAGINARARKSTREEITGNWTFSGDAVFTDEFWAKSGCIGVHDPGKSITHCYSELLGNSGASGWSFSDAVDNYSSPGATAQLVDICVIADPLSTTGVQGNKGPIIAYLRSTGTVYFKPSSFQISYSVPSITLPGSTTYSAMCSDGSALYILGKNGTVCTVYKYSYDVGTGVFTQTWSRILNRADCFGNYPTNRVKYMTLGYIVVLCGNVTCDTEGVIVSLNATTGAFNPSWNATAFGEAKGTGATDAARKPTGGLVCTANDTNSSKQVVAYSVGSLLVAGAVDASIHFAKISDGSAPILAGYNAPLFNSLQDRSGAMLDLVYDGHSIWYSRGVGNLNNYDSLLFAEVGPKILPYNEGGIMPVRFAAGFAGCMATDGFSVFAASAHETGGGTLLSKFPTHGDSSSWYDAGWATYAFPRAERIVAQQTSGAYLDPINCGRVCCDGTHVWVIATILDGATYYKSRVVRVPLYSIID